MTHPAPSAYARLDDEVSGPVLGPGDDGYDASRAVWNARFVREPDAVIRCSTPGDVAAGVRFAVEEGLEISVKGGGHDYAGNTVAGGGLLLDLAPMEGVEVDPEARTVDVGGGATWAAVDRATQAHGLAAPGATVSHVGVGGFTLGGGAGWLARSHGLAVDNLLAARVVTAAGDVVEASEDENPELFWALRGGGGNFGVVTSFRFRLHPVGPEVVASQVFYEAERAADLLRVYRGVFEDAPDDLTCYPFLIRIPPVEPFPEASHGRVALDFVAAWTGAPDEGEKHLAPFREQGDAILDLTGPQPYLALQQAFDAGMGAGNRWYSRSMEMDALEDDMIDALVAGLEPFPGAFTAVYMGPGGGALGRVSPDATAYPHRASAHQLHIFPGWSDPADDAATMAWADSLFDAVRPYGNGRVYVNLLGDGEEDRVPDAYRGNWDRLRAAKQTWDPDNVFHGNHTIPPAD